MGSFHCKFNLPYVSVVRPVTPHLLDDETYDFRLKFLNEELNEYASAHEERDLAKAADALIDLVYVAMVESGFDPGSRLRILQGSGHAPNEEHPQLTAETVLAHLLGTED